jgi:predicted unusual protein kinase regulating ubiquinone biosynthesis (AarF/ABC1/UbiB family)
MILAELDFEEEARNLERIARNHTSSKDILVPAVHRAHSTRRILTTDWVDGTKVTNVAELAARGVDPRQLASRLVHAFCEQIFEHGVYHADPHPGNILVTPDGRIALVDFGAVAELSPTMREGIVQFLHGVLAADTDRICASLQTMGFVNRGAGSAEVLERVVAHFHERFTRSVRVESLHLRDVRVDPAEALDALLDLRRMDIGLRELGEAFHVPREWVLLERTLLLLMGLCTTLDPELRPMALVRPYVERLVLGDRDYTAFAVETAREVGLQYLTLPAEVKRLVVAANRGRLELRSRDVRDATRTVYALGHQVIWAAFTITSVVLAAVFRIEGDAESASTASLTAWGFGALLAISMVRHRLRRGGS